MVRHEVLEVARGHDQQLAIIDGRDVRYPAGAAQQRHLAEELACGQKNLPPGDRHLDAARRDEVDAVGAVALADDAITRRRRAGLEHEEEFFTLLRLDRGKERETLDYL